MKTYKLSIIFFLLFNHVVSTAGGFIESRLIFQNNNRETKKQPLKKIQVISIMQKVANWQFINQPNVKYDEREWMNATLFRGIMELANISHENDKYLNWLLAMGNRNNWRPYKRTYHADDIGICQIYLDLYKLDQNIKMIEPTQTRTDWRINNQPSSSLNIDYSDTTTLQRWSWCDALFMAPPVYAQMYNITHDQKYLDFMDKEYKVTYNFLYDKKEKLFFRDCTYFTKKESNGEKVFWGRGNGWVLGGLVKILKELPKDCEKRKFYEDLFKDMCEKIGQLQDKKGYWHASLLDPEAYPNPEMSCTGFYVYALAYGINSGLIDRGTYLPKVIKGWKALNKAVFSDGKLGWIQPIGGDPQKVTKDMTEVYGVGAFLLASSEVYKLAL
jgi:rhamnogalacturonyl hydrolase YesR